MSWVLILRSYTDTNEGVIPSLPAVVGGYRTQEEAEEAGKIATDPFYGWPKDAKYGYHNACYASARGDKDALKRWEEMNPTLKYKTTHWSEYSVIPGAADTAPA